MDKKTPKPGDYELGSVQSRAAARALMQDKQNNDDDTIQIVYVSPDGTKENGPLLRRPPTVGTAAVRNWSFAT